jgi:hypothetical protein
MRDYRQFCAFPCEQNNLDLPRTRVKKRRASLLYSLERFNIKCISIGPLRGRHVLSSRMIHVYVSFRDSEIFTRRESDLGQKEMSSVFVCSWAQGLDAWYAFY